MPLLGTAGSGGWSRNSQTRRRIQLLLIVLLALDAILLMLLLRPAEEAQRARQQTVQRLQSEHNAVVRAVAQKRDLRVKVQGARQDGEDFTHESFLSKNRAFSKILADLEALASANHLKPSGVSYVLNEEKEHPGWTDVTVTVNVEGNYSDLVHFINELERSDLFWIIDGLSVGSAAAKDLQMNLQMETYFAPQ